jgi:hypothetical protein
MRFLFLASTSWLESVCYLAKEIINAKIVYKFKNWIFSIEACIQITFFFKSFHFLFLFFAYQF